MQKPLKILQASAGSGKTFSLAVHYLTLLFANENSYREILAVTFTNKATEEMKSRILEVLKGLALADESKKIEDYRALILKAHPNINRADLKFKADIIYRKILHDYSRFSVSTIDGFVQKVIRGFAFELGLDASYSLEMNINKVKDELVERLDKELDHNQRLLQWMIDLALERIGDNKSWNYRNELLELTSEIFKERFQVFEDAIQVLGVENLDELFSTYIALTKEEIKSFEENVVTLAKEGLEMMAQEGVVNDDLKGKSRSPLWKFHKLVGKDLSGLDSLFGLIDNEEGWFQKGKGNAALFNRLNGLLKKLEETMGNGFAKYNLAIAFNKNVYYLRLMQEMAVLLKLYREENGNLLISDAQKLLNGITEDAGENPSFIWEKMGNRYRNFLFDEFQDTSANQWNSFKSLLINAMAAPNEKLIDHLIVGDTKQSIYRWRNGDWNILHRQAGVDVGEHNVLEDSLEENYRSASNIIAFNNLIYKQLPQKIQQKLNEEIPERELEWWQSLDYDNIVNRIYKAATQKNTPFTPEGGTIKINKISKPEEEERAFTEVVFREYALQQMTEEIIFLKEKQKYKASDICVLVRSNSEAFQVVNVLMDAGIDVVSGDALLIANNTAIKLILNTLQVFIGVSENTSLYKANCMALYAKTEDRALNPTHYFGLKNKSLAHLTAVLPADLCLNWQSWLQLPLPELAEKIIKSYGLDTKEIHLPYLLAFRDLVANAASLGEKGVSSFLTWWDEEGSRKTLPSPEKAEAVQIITIHKSKGLAFRAVLIPFCNWTLGGKPNAIFWVSSQNTPYQHLQSIPLKYGKDLGNSSVAKAYFEELLFNYMDALNMLYVATTRCKDYLYISTIDKKINNLTTVGDLLNAHFEHDFDEEGNYFLEKYLQIEEKTNEDGLGIEMDFYPTSERLTEIFDPTEERHSRHILNTEHSGRKGSILHEVLANAGKPNEVEEMLDLLLSNGVIKINETEEFRTEALQVLQNPDLRSVLQRGKESLAEREIISADGKTLRPDRVLINNDEVIIVDYKFTAKPSDTHNAQLKAYKNLFYEMGYAKVSAYLFYAENKQLKEV